MTPYANMWVTLMGPLQLEAAWALSCIASGTARHAQVVIDAGASDFIHLLSSPDVDIKLLAVWALGNISGESSTNRNSLLHQGALQPLLALLRERAEQPEPGSVLGYATWALSNFCKDQPDWELVNFRSSLSVTFTYIHDQISPALTDLGRLIRSQDEIILIDACWAISFLLDGDASNKKIQAIIETGIHERLTELLNHSSVCVQTPALRSVGDIVTGDDLHTQAVIASGALPALLSLLSSPDANIRAEACWTISNITAGSSTQIQAVIDAKIIPPLIDIMQKADDKSKLEACWAISNAISGAVHQPSQIWYIIQQGCIKPLCNLLSYEYSNQVALNALDNILKAQERDSTNPAVTFETDDVAKIHSLQLHQRDLIYRRAYDIMEKHFPEAATKDLEAEMK